MELACRNWATTVPHAALSPLTAGGTHRAPPSFPTRRSSDLSDSHDISVDETASLTITTPIALDNVINAAESGDDLAISGTTSGVEAGQHRSDAHTTEL